ncbi:unnamed protein product [Rhizophagus irregularis]|nr:unnamed protein product [Rhizophagus irregularis]
MMVMKVLVMDGKGDVLDFVVDLVAGDEGVVVLLNNDDGGNSKFVIVGDAAGDLVSVVFVVALAVDDKENFGF